MFIFIRLLLAHFIGDFPLQFNKIYELKHKGLKRGIPHAILVVICLVILSWPYLKIPGLWGFIFFVGVMHLLQDSIKITYGKIKYSFWSYLLDQFFHIATIVIVFFTNLKNVQPPKETGGFIASFYNNDAVFIYLIAIIVATYNGFYLMRNFKNTFFGNAGTYNFLEKWYGMFERAEIVSIFFLGGYFFFLIPIVLFVRPLIFSLGRNRFNISRQFISASEMVLSWTIAIVTGIGLYLIVQRL